MRASRVAIFVALAIVAAGCAPAVRAPAGPAAPASQASPPAASQVLTASIGVDPPFIAALAPIPSQNASDFYTRMFNAFLEIYDDQSQPHPYLAEALPQLNTDSWQVFPDGTMETRYHLKPNLVWHDGAPLTADDFAFTFKAATPANGFRTAVVPYTLMADVQAPDDRTIVIRWKSIYPDAGVLLGGDTRFGLVPLPRHLLEDTFNQGPEAIQGSLYWTSGFVGAGPYKVDHWEIGSYVDAVPFDQHVLGRPKIDRIRLLFVPDHDTAFANLLAGTTQVALDSITFPQMLQLKQQWATTGQGTAGLTVASLTAAYFQLRPEYASPHAILDPRVRQAMAYGFDKQAIADTIWAGELAPWDTIFSPTSPYYPAIESAITKYGFDPRASEQLMNDAGYTRGPDGFFAGPPEGKLSFVLRAPPTRPELPVLAANWRQAGFDVQERPASPAESGDPQLGSTFPSANLAASGASEALQIAGYLTSQIRRAETRWQGQNLTGWSSPAFDQLVDAFNVTLDQNTRIQQRVQMAQLISADVPAIMLTPNPNMHAYLAVVKNVTPAAPALATGRITWNIEQWELQ